MLSCHLHPRGEVGGRRAGKDGRHVGIEATNLHLETLTERQRGHVAAFLDGEGGIQEARSHGKDRCHTIPLHPAVYFTNAKEEATRSIRKRLGGGSVAQRKETGNREGIYVLTTSGVRSILVLLEAVRPMLTIKAGT